VGAGDREDEDEVEAPARGRRTRIGLIGLAILGAAALAMWTTTMRSEPGAAATDARPADERDGYDLAAETFQGGHQRDAVRLLLDQAIELHGHTVDDATVRQLSQLLRVMFLNYGHDEMDVLEAVVCWHEPGTARSPEQAITSAIASINAGRECVTEE
jgi:hypothetical protein